MYKSDFKQFQADIRAYYQTHGRHDLPWRIPELEGNFDTYKILISEFMLQQTQVQRVIPKYQEFLVEFPTITDLAAASLGDVLKAWSGLGYNRRAQYLHLAAQNLCAEPQPWQYESLVKCKGVGPNTAAAILAYSYNQPLIFIETNIRTVYIHHFFGDEQAVADAAILPLVEKTLDQVNPREFYWALMDYGTHLKKRVGNLSSKSKHYTKQSQFQGSLRQVRGTAIRLLTKQSLSDAELQAYIQDERLADVLHTLQTEGLILKRGNYYQLA